MSEVETEEPRLKAELSSAELDELLTLQLVVAFAGEGGDEPRMGWWRTDLVSEFGGHDLFMRLLPRTWAWAALQAVREAATRVEAALRAEVHDRDQLLSLFHLGFLVDERLDERLLELKLEGRAPEEALPGLEPFLIPSSWREATFLAWVKTFGPVDTVPAPLGRRLKGEAPSSPVAQARRLVGALDPLSTPYPLPFLRSPE